ncbi:S-methyl-5-thioribose-1-phosphate isomerase [Chloroflexus sp.]|uniref:S-methyl-5-thioribose-1-phosphate isomerase n=1 Tax=Chloroflexus sp. TaxID=1904827 RepID=UPI00298F15BA|nr:S-methyl-5-thioribose-1-phosphate isomerase [Chloroflexus sp.]MCS6887766.1 S-methyl-5-thioribose-1-phosphate isomerase [Chloroflexus sp.]MDW8404384.1 S-methyl-5-thioribose-1-phosphate isomerase [Chloroflexus sp.]
MELRTVWWEEESVRLIDQRKLPHTFEVVHCTELSHVAHAIRSMQVRGAPAIGCTAAYGMALVARQSSATTPHALLAELRQAKATLDAQRPTAVNLAWATSRMLRRAEAVAAEGVVAIKAALLAEAEAIYAEDLAMCHAIGDHGAPLIPPRGHVLTHCNAGGLATAGYGTALAPIRTAFAQGRPIHVFVDETRPFLQGARLTAWELLQAGIPQTLITDNMAAFMMQRGLVDCIIVGADRIAANGDVANKIGTYGLAVLARYHNIPFYVAAPYSTIDLATASGAEIPIEERDPAEVTHIAGIAIAPQGVNAAHPAFDVTPHELVTAIITERGVVKPPFTDALRQLASEP